METNCLMLGQKRTAQFQPSKWSVYRRSAHAASKMEPRSTALTPYLLDEYYKDSDLAEKLKEAKKR